MTMRFVAPILAMIVMAGLAGWMTQGATVAFILSLLFIAGVVVCI